MLTVDIQNELNALKYVSNDALKTIAQEQLPNNVQQRSEHLLDRNNLNVITKIEHRELIQLNVRADELMLRKAEASSILRKRGYNFSRKIFYRMPELSWEDKNELFISKLEDVVNIVKPVR